MASGIQEDAEAESSCCLYKLPWIALSGLTLCNHVLVHVFWLSYIMHFQFFSQEKLEDVCWVQASPAWLSDHLPELESSLSGSIDEMIQLTCIILSVSLNSDSDIFENIWYNGIFNWGSVDLKEKFDLLGNMFLSCRKLIKKINTILTSVRSI